VGNSQLPEKDIRNMKEVSDDWSDLFKIKTIKEKLPVNRTVRIVSYCFFRPS